jgi:hypothetical protein
MKIFKQNPLYHFDFGGGAFTADFYFKDGSIEKSYLEINTRSNIFSMRFDARTYPYGYLFASAQQGKEDNIHGFCAMMFQIAMSALEDTQLARDLSKSILAYNKRMEKSAKNNAKGENSEDNTADEQLIEESIKYAKMDGKQRKKAKEQFRADVKEVISENKQK